MTIEGESEIGRGFAPRSSRPRGAANALGISAPEPAAVEDDVDPHATPTEDPINTGEKLASSADRRSESAVKRKSQKKAVEKPKTISELFQFMYGETIAGRKPNLARNLWDLRMTPDESQQEIELVRLLAAGDPLLDALSNTLVGVAESDLKDSVRRRVLELSLVAFASHKLFEGSVERLVDAKVEPRLTAAEISHKAGCFDFDADGVTESLEVTGSKREKLRVNAVIAFELFRVLRDGWSKTQFIADFCEVVWRAPSRFQFSPRVDPVTGEKDTQDQSQWRTVAMLANARSATEALSELKRHFEVQLRDRDKKISAATDEAAAQSRRADREKATSVSLLTELEDKNMRLGELQLRVAKLEEQLEREQSGRFADEIHAVNDYEILRTQVIRQLSGQVSLLSDGLHALRNGSIAVADEFVDRVLGKIDAEVRRLKELDGRPQ
ncbi:hypothetical protein [Mycolicibacterium septicum]|uniref:hypothetical protein n=1 Tax=Mycolicibacterium septicum TaxID=98668 RepID=UPI001AF09677|nr:hypothetical protein [Mycolicibacterium septicum]QRY53806.1 hypothetical protein JVX95_11055 [Mycolicibacterium septicum]